MSNLPTPPLPAVEKESEEQSIDEIQLENLLATFLRFDEHSQVNNGQAGMYSGALVANGYLTLKRD